MKIYLGTDHAGYDLKEKLKQFLVEDLGHDVTDFGAESFDEGDDYPDFIVPVARAVATDDGSFGIVFGGSGQGEAMSANREHGVRAVVYYGGPTEIITLSREHNNANILSIGARFISLEEAKNVVKLWLGTEFSGNERHQRRINKLDK
ncbi:MAG TPA: ribose 5-phosphate isomerase B [Candidatus Pacebacteria bacterium]|nr:ribose 5-phosphate isomerase B [Candidatus Paceibacterota bacterium]